MRITYKINRNTFSTYEASAESTILVGEVNRHITPENFIWDKTHCPNLNVLCIETINKNFINKPILDELPCQDRDHLLEILDVNLPLPITIPLIEDEIYWKRCYESKFGSISLEKVYSWKSRYLEKYVEDVLEQAQPEYNDEFELDELLTLCARYITKLSILQLQAWKPPLFWDEDDIPEFYPNDHINFEPIFKKLLNIEEFEVVYGVKNVSDKFTWHMFKVSISDCQRLGKALNHLKSLRVLKIHRSKLEDQHIRSLMQGFVKNETVEELDLSNCLIGDDGALCIAKILCVHHKLKNLNLSNNKIGLLGAEGLGYALLHPTCSLITLDLKFNPLKEGGTMGILRALVRGTTLENLILARCQFDENAAIRVGQMLLLNTSLKKLDVSNNWFDEEGGAALIDGLKVNKTLEWLDIRETDIPSNQMYEIRKLLHRNRCGSMDTYNISTEDAIPDNVSENISENNKSTESVNDTTSSKTQEDV